MSSISRGACEKFAKYLIGLDRFELQTDHKPLVPLMTTKDIDRTPVRCQRLQMRLMRFNAEVKHVPGKHIVIANALSRSPLDHSPADKDIDEAVSTHVVAVEASRPISSTRLDFLRAATIHDAELQQVIKYVCSGWPHMIPSHLQAHQQAQGELSIVKALRTVGGSLFQSTSDTISWKRFMNHTRDYTSADRGPRGRRGSQVSAEIRSSSSMSVENAENIVQISGLSRSTLLFYLVDHCRSWGRISFPSRARTIWWWLTTIPGSWKLPDFTL